MAFANSSNIGVTFEDLPLDVDLLRPLFGGKTGIGISSVTSSDDSTSLTFLLPSTDQKKLLRGFGCFLRFSDSISSFCCCRCRRGSSSSSSSSSTSSSDFAPTKTSKSPSSAITSVHFGHFLIPTIGPYIPSVPIHVRVSHAQPPVLMMHGELINRRRSPARKLQVHFIHRPFHKLPQSVFKFPAVLSRFLIKYRMIFASRRVKQLQFYLVLHLIFRTKLLRRHQPLQPPTKLFPIYILQRTQMHATHLQNFAGALS